MSTIKPVTARRVISPLSSETSQTDSAMSRIFTKFVKWSTADYRATRSFSILRILYGFGMLLFLIPSYADRAYVWGFASTWVDPEVKRRGYAPIFQEMFPKDNPFIFDASYWALILLVLLFLVGYKTRFVTPLLLLFWIGLQTNSMLVTNGGDTIYRITLSFLIFANLSKHFSVDAWLTAKREQRSEITKSHRFQLPVWLGAGLHNTVLILCCFQIMLVYVNSGIYKLMGAEWIDGSAFYYSLVLDAFTVFPSLSEMAWQVTPFVLIATWLSIYCQLFFPVLLLSKYTRYPTLVILLGMHIGIGLMMGLWSFSLAMIALDMLFIRDKSWTSFIESSSRAVRKLLKLNDKAPKSDPKTQEKGSKIDAFDAAIFPVIVYAQNIDRVKL